MTQEELSAKLGRGGSVRAIQDWENNRRTPHPRTMERLRVILGLPGDESQTRGEWPARVQTVTQTLGDLLAQLPADELRRWRHEFIVRFVPPEKPRRVSVAWPDDAEVIVDLIGAYLVAGTDYEDMTDRS